IWNCCCREMKSTSAWTYGLVSVRVAFCSIRVFCRWIGKYLLWDDNRANQTWFGHNVVVPSFPIESTSLFLTERDEFLPVNWAHASYPHCRARQYRQEWIPLCSRVSLAGCGHVAVSASAS